MAVTSKDIARELGISQSTVSRALRAIACRRRDAAASARCRPTAELHPEPCCQEADHPENANRWSRRRRHHQSVLSRAARHPPQRVRARELPNDPAQRADRRPTRAACAQLINGGAVDGLVYVSAVLGIPLRRGWAPTVLLDGDQLRRRMRSCPQRGGGRPSGCRGTPQPRPPTHRSDRGAGEHLDEPGSGARFHKTVRASGAPLDERLRRVGQFSHKSGYQWCLDLLAADPRPTALFAANDGIAFGALDAARRLSVRVPEELSVVGFDDIDMAGWEGFNLTTAPSRSPRWRAPPPGSSWSESTPESPCLPEGESSRSSSSTTTLAAAPPG